MIDPAAALAAAARLRSHLPPYFSILPTAGEEDEDVEGRSEEAGAGQP